MPAAAPNPQPRPVVLGVLVKCQPGAVAKLPLPLATEAQQRRRYYRAVASAAAQLWGTGCYSMKAEPRQLLITRLSPAAKKPGKGRR